jgi:isopenicillin-N epimerase
LDPDFYVGILHKWLCAPKGCAFLYARRDMQERLDPLIVSWGWAPRNPNPSKFIDYHEWQGSRDVSEYLAVPDAIAFQQEHNWDRVRAQCRELASWAQQEVTRLTKVPLYHLDSAEWSGQVVCAQLPATVQPDAFKNRLRFEHNIEVSVDSHRDWPRIRISVQGYNTQADIERLLGALKRLLADS